MEGTLEAPRQPGSEELHLHHLQLVERRPGTWEWGHWLLLDLLDLQELKVEEEEEAVQHHAVPAGWPR